MIWICYASGIVVLKTFDDYYNGYTDGEEHFHEGYVQMIEELVERFPLTEPRIIGEQNQKDFANQTKQKVLSHH